METTHPRRDREQAVGKAGTCNPVPPTELDQGVCATSDTFHLVPTLRVEMPAATLCVASDVKSLHL